MNFGVREIIEHVVVDGPPIYIKGIDNKIHRKLIFILKIGFGGQGDQVFHN